MALQLVTFSALPLKHRVAAVEKAEAEKIQVVKAAEGDAESKYLAGQVCLVALSPSDLS